MLPISNKEAYWFVFQSEKLLILKGQQTSLLNDHAIVTLQATFIRQYPLAELNNHAFFCAELKQEYVLPEHLETITLRNALELLGADKYTLAAKAYSIINWDKNHQYCGRCGSPTVYRPGAFERFCADCSMSFFPRISPSIIVLIRKGDHIMMSRGYHFPPGIYGLIAGFVEAGETIEEAVHREISEEIGITIKNLKYFGSQSWPFPDSLMIAFTADYQSGELNIDYTELADAGWYRYDQLPGGPSTSISIARRLIDHFVKEQSQLR